MKRRHPFLASEDVLGALEAMQVQIRDLAQGQAAITALVQSMLAADALGATRDAVAHMQSVLQSPTRHDRDSE